MLATVADDGEMVLWNLDSGTLRRRARPEGHARLPANEQAVEAVRFLRGDLRGLIVTVGGAGGVRLPVVEVRYYGGRAGGGGGALPQGRPARPDCHGGWRGAW